MSLFGKKKCCACGENIGAFYRKKLPCGFICEKCSHQISPLVKYTKFTDVDRLKEHLEYRKESSELLEKFQITRIIGEKERIVIDDKNQLVLFATEGDKWTKRQPDVIHFDQITGFDEYIEVIDSGDYYESSEGIENEVPKGYVSCNFSFILTIDSPWFSVMPIQINRDELITDDINSAEYRKYKEMLDEVKETFRPYYRSARKIS
ncbi:MAG: hypothetical protein J6U36_00355 [Oscillospiraceae bacterium]|nr:hypothetical protein [Oscillospiraceae bacterium]MBP1567077.1 hypothetical protein [Oscillospiraceae bacterium]MBR3535661.1 hypothetical protein [Oscillospiraceae bacterium]MBR6836738.1 hypothetical protein [Oscillospiraceae bacterium]